MCYMAGEDPRKFSPRMWGCTYRLASASHNIRSFPHACGGVPLAEMRERQLETFSPRMWGCTWLSFLHLPLLKVFPTHVGVYRNRLPGPHRRACFPHACGGVPITDGGDSSWNRFSPRMWGCTEKPSVLTIEAAVFPTHVGVYLNAAIVQKSPRRFPHACGGVPASSRNRGLPRKFSPRMWGCT